MQAAAALLHRGIPQRSAWGNRGSLDGRPCTPRGGVVVGQRIQGLSLLAADRPHAVTPSVRLSLDRGSTAMRASLDGWGLGGSSQGGSLRPPPGNSEAGFEAEISQYQRLGSGSASLSGSFGTAAAAAVARRDSLVGVMHVLPSLREQAQQPADVASERPPLYSPHSHRNPDGSVNHFHNPGSVHAHHHGHSHSPVGAGGSSGSNQGVQGVSGSSAAGLSGGHDASARGVPLEVVAGDPASSPAASNGGTSFSFEQLSPSAGGAEDQQPPWGASPGLERVWWRPLYLLFCFLVWAWFPLSRVDATLRRSFQARALARAHAKLGVATASAVVRGALLMAYVSALRPSALSYCGRWPVAPVILAAAVATVVPLARTAHAWARKRWPPRQQERAFEEMELVGAVSLAVTCTALLMPAALARDQDATSALLWALGLFPIARCSTFGVTTASSYIFLAIPAAYSATAVGSRLLAPPDAGFGGSDGGGGGHDLPGLCSAALLLYVILTLARARWSDLLSLQHLQMMRELRQEEDSATKILELMIPTGERAVGMDVALVYMPAPKKSPS